MRKLLIGAGIVTLLILGAAFIYNKLNPAPQPVAVTAEPIERERVDENAEKLKALEEKNSIDKLLEKGDDVAYQYLSYAEDGSELFNIMIVATDSNVLYMDASGHIEYLEGGKWVGFDPEENNVYTMVCIKEDAYDAEWDYLRDSASFYFDTLTVTDDIKTNGDYTTVTRSAKITEENLEMFQKTWPSVKEGDKFMDVYTFADDQFLTEVYSIVRNGEEESEEITLGKVIMTIDSGLTMDEGMLEMVNSDEQRTLTLGIDTGTDDERSLTVKTGVGTEFLFSLPDGYNAVYMDKECKVPLENQDLNEDLEAYIYETK